jgi:trans-2,3-dihydro-3-hydroxyanthranilate isomerase
MAGSRFYIADVFAERKYAGNQLAVVRDVSDFAEESFQAIAREMNYSETTFIMSDELRNGGYDVRIFTPGTELPFAGHPTLGTAWIIQQEIIGTPVEKVVLNLKVGQIPVTFKYHGDQPSELWMKQVAPTFGDVIDKRQMAACLNVEPDDIDDRFPIEEVSTGVFCFIVPLKTLDALKKARTNLDFFYKLIEKTEAKAPLLFCPETYDPENALCVRFFADALGIVEDPATGSANGSLAGYLARHRYFGDSKVDIRVEQGIEIKRPSLLLLKSEDKGDTIDVYVGGKVIPVAKGELV